MKKDLILCLLLALAMMVSLTACQVEIPGIGTCLLYTSDAADE
mgnify:CR=1 FL=1